MRGALAVAVGLAIAAVGTARSQAQAQPAFPVEIVAAVAPEGAGSAVLVGRSGQLYVAGADRVWRRKGAGGIATDVRAAVRSPTRPVEVIATGDEAPPFRFTGTSWKADVQANRGSAVLSRGGGVPALSIGRHVHTLDKNAWVRRTSTGKVATAVWAASEKAILVATSDGALGRWDGRRLAPIKTGLPAGDPLVMLLGAQPRQVYGRSKAGRWIRITGASTGSLPLARELDGFDEQAAATAADGALLLAGTVPAPDGGRKAVLARAEQNRIRPWQDLAPLADGDRFAVVFAQGGEVLVATRAGSVRVRGADGTWREGRVAGELPAPGARVRRSPPARSR